MNHIRQQLFDIIFEAETRLGKLFDVVLIFTILASVLVVMLDSVNSIHAQHGRLLYILEWIFTVLFTIEYLLRLMIVQRPWAYARSFYGVVDLLGCLPTYISLIIPGSQALLIIRVLRVLRIFRVLKLAKYMSEADMLMRALRASRRKIFVFLFGVITLVIILGSMMYLIEGEEHGFANIPISIYWAVVTLTTVGYGDISPQTGLGQTLAGFIMILGYSIIAVPTGIVSVEIGKASRAQSGDTCPSCSAEGHDSDAVCCKYCGTMLNT